MEVEDGIDPALLLICEVDAEAEDGIDPPASLFCEVGLW